MYGRHATTFLERSGWQRLCRSSGILKVQGDDATKFLQGMVTKDMRRLQGGGHTLLLNTKSRIEHAVCIYKCEREANTYYIESEASLQTDLITSLRKYLLRARVSMENVSHEMQVLCSDHASTSASLITMKDERGPFMGYRHLQARSASPDNGENEEESYLLRRLLQGIAEGSGEVHNAIPHEISADQTRQLDFDKGCYLGQELVIRTEHTGIVRKRLLPFCLDAKQFELTQQASPIDEAVLGHPDKMAARGTRLLQYMPKYGVGMAIVRMTEAANAPLQGYILNGTNPITFYTPPWWQL